MKLTRRQEVEQLHAELIDLFQDLVRLLRENGVHDHGEDRGDEADRRGVHGFGDTRREDRLALLRVSERDSLERTNETRDRAEKAEEGRDVRDQGEIRKATL